VDAVASRVRILDLHPAAIVRPVKARVVLRDDALEAELASYLRIEERELEGWAASLRSRRFEVLVSADFVVSTAQRTNMAQEHRSQLRVEFIAGFSVGVLCHNGDDDHDQRVEGYQDADPKSDVDPHAPNSLPTAADGGLRGSRPDRKLFEAQTLRGDDPSRATCASRSERLRLAG
jgi:hypothetical protein